MPEPVLITKTKEKLPTRMRRMDELAWLLENTSMCTAVSVIDGKFYIAANEFFDHTETKDLNKQLTMICNIMEYFKLIATDVSFVGEKRQEQRDELIRSILQNQMSIASLGRIAIPEKIITSIVCSDVLKAQQLPDTSDKELNQYINKRKGPSYQALGYGIEIYKRFLKIEKAIQLANSSNYCKITKEQLNAFKTFNHDDANRPDSNVLFLAKDDDKHVHAEAQVLDRIVDLIEIKKMNPGEIYIGISKRCCKNCHCLLDAANDALNGTGHVIKFEGAHDAEFTTNWGKPPMLQQVELDSIGKTRSRTKELPKEDLSLKKKINNIYQEKVRNFETSQLSQEPYNKRHTPSTSEATSDTTFEQYKETLQQDLANAKDDVKALKIGIILCDIAAFRELFDQTSQSLKDSLDPEATLTNIMLQHNDKMTETDGITREDLLAFLRNNKFCPPRISSFFMEQTQPLETLKSSSPAFSTPESKKLKL